MTAHRLGREALEEPLTESYKRAARPVFWKSPPEGVWRKNLTSEGPDPYHTKQKTTARSWAVVECFQFLREAKFEKISRHAKRGVELHFDTTNPSFPTQTFSIAIKICCSRVG